MLVTSNMHNANDFNNVLKCIEIKTLYFFKQYNQECKNCYNLKLHKRILPSKIFKLLKVILLTNHTDNVGKTEKTWH